jgi:hypothetical protein
MFENLMHKYCVRSFVSTLVQCFPYFGKSLIAAIVVTCALVSLPSAAVAQELLQNRSFESPVAPANGNNFYATMPNWTTTYVGTAQPLPVNIIKAFSTYGGGPLTTPPLGGTQYFDVNGRAGAVLQTVTLATAGLVDYGVYYSTRDGITNVPGMTINIRNSANAVVSTVTGAFTAADTLYSWKLIGASNVPLAAGSYTIEIIVPDLANIDLASFVYKPPLQLTKSSVVISDPVNNTTNPKFIPGAIVEYTLTVTNPTTSTYSVVGNTIFVVDKTPVGLEFGLATITPGTGPASFATTNALTTYTFTSLASTTDGLDFAYDATGTIWTNSPSAGAIANGYDPLITFIRLKVGGSMPAGASFNFRIRYRLK